MASLKEAQTEKAKAQENPFNPKNGPSPTHPRSRKGKTRKDRANGQAGKNQQNKDMRASWQQNSKNTSFPASACNGKRNRYQWTGKNGETIYADAKRK
jgi:hypothetical protein